MPLHAPRPCILPLFALLCTACATGGGSFDTLSPPPRTEINTWDTGPTEEDKIIEGVLQPPPTALPEYGFTAAEPYTIRTSGDPQPLDPSRVSVDLDAGFNTVTYHRHPDTVGASQPASEKISIDPDAWAARPNAQDYSEYVGGNDGKYRLIADDRNILKVATFDYTRVGMVSLQAPSPYAPTLANIFYKGSARTDAMPVMGRATYQGYWERVLATRAFDDVNGYHGNMLVASRASFDVDFGGRRLQGTLDGKNGERGQGYTLQAEISGANFSGTATPADYSNNQEEALVSGSFFGPHAAELAGRLAGRQRGAAGVFAARQITSSDIVEGEATSLSIGLQADAAAPEGPESRLFQPAHALDYSGNIHVLRFNGVDIDLRQLNAEQGHACCTDPQLQFAQFGVVQAGQDTDASPRLLYFAQGSLTPRAEMPSSGQASYRGQWTGFGRAPAGQAYIASPEYGARFTADFGQRTLAGALQGRSGADVIDIQARIEGNRFEGTTTIKHPLTSDDQGMGMESAATIRGSGRLRGAFHGPEANELAGHFIHEDQRFGGVFGAKQQISTKP